MGSSLPHASFLYSFFLIDWMSYHWLPLPTHRSRQCPTVDRRKPHFLLETFRYYCDPTLISHYIRAYSMVHRSCDIRPTSSLRVFVLPHILNRIVVHHYWCAMHEVTELHKVDLLEIVPMMHDSLEWRFVSRDRDRLVSYAVTSTYDYFLLWRRMPNMFSHGRPFSLYRS